MRAREQRDQGSALTMAIVFVTVIGLAMTIALGYASTTIKATSKSYQPARSQLYAANAAVKTAIAYTQTTPAEGRYTGAGKCSTARTYGTVDGQAITSQVCPRTTTSLVLTGGGGGGTPIGLRTLATGSEVGIDVAGQGGLKVYGSVVANSSISVATSSRMDVNGGTVKAIGGCKGSVYVDGVAISGCTVAASPAPAVDPNYTVSLPSPLPNGTGSCSSNVATLDPGLWTQSTLDAAIGKCNYVWLKPGYHVLNNVDWSIKYRVVGGTLNGSITTSALGSGCVANAATGGATVVLGGTSDIALSGSTATLEVCGQNITQADNSVVRIPLYGLKADVLGAGSSASMTNSGGVSQTDTAAKDWDSRSNAQSVDREYSTVDLDANGSSEEIRVPGFAASPAVPASVSQLTVDVWGLAGGTTTFAVRGRNSSNAQICGTAANPTTAAVTGTFPSSYNKVTVTLTCTTPIPSSVTIAVTATAGASPAKRTVSLDGVNVSFQRPGTPIVTAQSGCNIQVNGCASLSSNGNANLIALEGELYMPLGKVDVQLPNSSGAFTTRGVTVRVFKVNAPASVQATPGLATDYASTLSAGDVTVVVKVGTITYMTCRVTFQTSGTSITGSTITACTAPA